MNRNIWNEVSAYVKACCYTYTEKHFLDLYMNNYLRGLYCPHTFNDVMDNYEKYNKDFLDKER
jgi:hypothetical protein